MVDTRQPVETSFEKLVWLLSLGGYVPFAIAAIGIVWLGENHAQFSMILAAFKIWSAIILSFLGGIRWGFAISSTPPDVRNLIFSVVPAILAWFLLLFPSALTILGLLVLFCIHGIWDNTYLKTEERILWFGKVRVALTLLVALAHIVAFLGVVA